MAKYQFEGADIVTPFTIYSNQPSYDVETVSLKIQRASQGYQRWELSFTTVLADDKQVDSFLHQLENFDSNNTMVMPQFEKPLSEFTCDSDTPGIAIAGSTGDTSIWISGASADGIIPKGMFFKFSNHDKVYVTTNSIDLAGNLARELEFYPALRSAVSTGATLELDDQCVLTYKQDINNMTGMTFSDGIIANSGTIVLIEAL
jgi:hypothetical protein